MNKLETFAAKTSRAYRFLKYLYTERTRLWTEFVYEEETKLVETARALLDLQAGKYGKSSKPNLGMGLTGRLARTTDLKSDYETLCQNFSPKVFRAKIFGHRGPNLVDETVRALSGEKNPNKKTLTEEEKAKINKIALKTATPGIPVRSNLEGSPFPFGDAPPPNPNARDEYLSKDAENLESNRRRIDELKTSAPKEKSLEELLTWADEEIAKQSNG